jgi:hypothetical protein
VVFFALDEERERVDFLAPLLAAVEREDFAPPRRVPDDLVALRPVERDFFAVAMKV